MSSPAFTWEVLRRQVAICGTVRDKNNLPIHGALVSAACTDIQHPPYTTLSRSDGSYFFTELPERAYSVSATWAGSTKSGQATLQIDKDGTLHRVTIDFTLGI